MDAVVTDKKGAYVHDLEAKDFKVWEDNKEQQIKSFSFEAGIGIALQPAEALSGPVLRQLDHGFWRRKGARGRPRRNSSTPTAGRIA